MIYFGDYEIRKGFIGAKLIRYMMDYDVIKALDFRYRGFRYTNKDCLKVLWV